MSGMEARLFLDPANRSEPTDRLSDVGVDGQYLYSGAGYSVSGHISLTREHQSRAGSFAASLTENSSGSLHTFKGNVSYVLRHRHAASFGYVSIGGNRDALLYAGDTPFVGSRTGSPDSTALLAEFDYLPISRLKLSAQLTATPNSTVHTAITMALVAMPRTTTQPICWSGYCCSGIVLSRTTV